MVMARSKEVCLATLASWNAAEMQPELSADDKVCRADGNSTLERVLGRVVLTRSRRSSMRAWWRSRRGGDALFAWLCFAGVAPADDSVQERCSSLT
jgi:hypothetical protein